MLRLGIFGGTFNPVHWGHLLVAQTALETRGLDRVVWVPNCRPSYKDGACVLAFEQRAYLLQLALCSQPNFDLHYPQPGQEDYAIDAFRELQKRYPQAQWEWIIGLDAFERLPCWYGRERLVEEVRWLVAPRSPHSSQTLTPVASSQCLHSCQQVSQQLAREGLSLQAEILPLPATAISSSLVRQYCRQGRSIRFLVPEAVAVYIEVSGCYRDRPTPSSASG